MIAALTREEDGWRLNATMSSVHTGPMALSWVTDDSVTVSFDDADPFLQVESLAQAFNNVFPRGRRSRTHPPTRVIDPPIDSDHDP